VSFVCQIIRELISLFTVCGTFTDTLAIALRTMAVSLYYKIVLSTIFKSLVSALISDLQLSYDLHVSANTM